MAIHVAMRTEMGKEDRRFKNLREQLIKAGGKPLFYCVSLFGIFLSNGCIITTVNASALYVSEQSSGTPLCVTDYIGIIIWFVGFIILTVADSQLANFKILREKNETNGERLCKTGLWAYSRHPNYFGESIVWWGIYLLAVSVPGGWITVWSPILIGVLLRFVSGVPLVEQLY
jgi:steroid 5-alpha reductase family enzyme